MSGLDRVGVGLVGVSLNAAGLEGDAATLAEFAGAVEADGIVLDIPL